MKIGNATGSQAQRVLGLAGGNRSRAQHRIGSVHEEPAHEYNVRSRAEHAFHFM
jgi:hypothetical protein